MDHYLKTEGNKIFYRVSGQGRPVLLIHGFGEDGNIWQAQAEFLKTGFRLIIPDLPGSGRSDLAGDAGMEEMAETIHAIIHQENIDRCTVIGHSMGGYLALALAEKYPNHLDALGLFHSTALADSPEKIQSRQKGIEFIREHGSYAFLKTVIPNLFSENSLMVCEADIERLVNNGVTFKPETLIAYYQAMMRRPDRSFVLRNIGLPVLFILGKKDRTVPLHEGLSQCYLPEKSYIHILKNSAHMGMLEEQQKSDSLLKNFLTDLCD
jgi:pimeloyl-ACP methyl ester carboxylesterase